MIRHPLHQDIQEKLLALRKTAKELTLEISQIGEIGGQLQLLDGEAEFKVKNGIITQDIEGEEAELDDESLSLKKLGSILDNTATNLGLWQD